MNFVAFGVGNFHFSLSDSWQGNSYEDYVAEVQQTLGKLPFVEDVKFDVPEKATRSFGKRTPPYPRIRDGAMPCPRAFPSTLSFVLHVPRNTQKKFLPHRSEIIRARLPEKFKIHMVQGYHSSVCFVECLNACKGVRPSDAVVVSQKLLEQELSKIESHVVFDFLEPSPFHANFLLSEASPDSIKEDSPSITPKITVQRGYNMVRFYYNPNKFDSCEQAKGALFHTLTHEAALFYYIRSQAVQLMRKWSKVMSSILDLADQKPDNKKWLTWKSRLFKQAGKLTGKSRLVRDTVQEVGLLRIQAVHLLHCVELAYRSVYQTGGLIEELVKKEKEEFPRYPLDEAKDLVDFYDQKSSKKIELLLVIGAALMSAVIGGLIGNFVPTLPIWLSH